MNVRRLAAIDMYGTRGTRRRRRIILAEFVVGVLAMVGVGGSAFSGYRWPRDVILTAVRWYLTYPLSSRQGFELLAERGIDVSHRTMLNWVQAFGAQLAAEVRRRRRPVGRCWFVDVVG